jgi:hypothetical protein
MFRKQIGGIVSLKPIGIFSNNPNFNNKDDVKNKETPKIDDLQKNESEKSVTPDPTKRKS